MEIVFDGGAVPLVYVLGIGALNLIVLGAFATVMSFAMKGRPNSGLIVFVLSFMLLTSMMIAGLFAYSGFVSGEREKLVDSISDELGATSVSFGEDGLPSVVASISNGELDGPAAIPNSSASIEGFKYSFNAAVDYDGEVVTVGVFAPDGTILPLSLESLKSLSPEVGEVAPVDR